MPELPEVETVCRGVRRRTRGLTVTRAEVFLPKIVNLRPAEFCRLVKGRRVLDVRRRAKTINIRLSGPVRDRPPLGDRNSGLNVPTDNYAAIRQNHSCNSKSISNGVNGYWLVVHLKMSGQLLYLSRTAPVAKHTHVVFHLSDGATLRYWDQRRFGYVRLFDDDGYRRFMEELSFGPEPLDKAFTLEVFRKLLEAKPKSRIKPLLLDQTFVSGIGNLYADEILFFARAHPLRRVSGLKPPEIKDIFRGIKDILALGVKKRGSSIELYVDAEGRPGGFMHYIKAYGREGEPCKRCGRSIERIKIGSRSAYFCSKCQRP